MLRLTFWLSAVFIGCLMGSLARAPTKDFVAGVSLPSWWHDEYAAPRTDSALRELRSLGVRWVALVPTVYQDGPGDDRGPRRTSSTADDQGLALAIRKARSLGLKVLLKPHVDCLDKSYRGHIGRGFDDDQWRRWFALYGEHLDRYARLGALEGVEAFCVGTELDVAAVREREWRALIARTRSLLGDPRTRLTYAANHGQEEIAFWDALDWIGVDAYYALSAARDRPSVDALLEGWRPHLDYLAALARRHQRPVVFTEIGYRSALGAWREPWAWGDEREVDLEAQRRLYAALLRVMDRATWLQGFFIWAWDIGADQGGPLDHGFTPRAKPAAEELRAFFARLPAPPERRWR